MAGFCELVGRPPKQESTGRGPVLSRATRARRSVGGLTASQNPFEIARAPAEVLRRHFSSAAELIVNLIWQALLYHQSGLEKEYGKTHRGFWYKPLDGTVERAGFVEYRLSKEAVERRYHRLLAQMVDRDRLFTYQELGFDDVYGTEREIGQRPEVLLMIEKGPVPPENPGSSPVRTELDDHRRGVPAGGRRIL